MCLPSESMNPVDIQQFAGCAVGLRRIVLDSAFKTDNICYELGQFRNTGVFPHAGVDRFRAAVVTHQEKTGRSKVVDVEKLAPWRTGSPNRHRIGSREFGVVKSPNQSGKNVGVLQIEIIARAVEIGRHDTDRIEAVLPTVGLAGKNAGNLGDGVSVVRWFERPCQQVFLADRLGRELGIDAGRTEKEQFGDTVFPGAVDDVSLNQQVLPNEISRKSLVGKNTANAGGGEKHIFGLLCGEKLLHAPIVE